MREAARPPRPRSSPHPADKRKQIANENGILLQRMKEMVEKGSLDRENPAAAYVGSLQKDRQKQEELRIADANHGLLRRIQRTRSSYERDALLREHREKVRLRDRISRRKPAPKERSAYERHYSTLTSFTAVPRSSSRCVHRFRPQAAGTCRLTLRRCRLSGRGGGHGPQSSFRARESRSVPSLPAV